KRTLFEAEIHLKDAFETLLYLAAISPNRGRYLKRLKRYLDDEQLVSFTDALSKIPDPAEDNETLIADAVTDLAEKLANQEIKVAEKALLSKSPVASKN